MCDVVCVLCVFCFVLLRGAACVLPCCNVCCVVWFVAVVCVLYSGVLGVGVGVDWS